MKFELKDQRSIDILHHLLGHYALSNMPMELQKFRLLLEDSSSDSNYEKYVLVLNGTISSRALFEVKEYIK